MSEKIGIVDIFRISKSGRTVYLKMDKKVLEAYDLKVGDKVKVEIKEKVVNTY